MLYTKYKISHPSQIQVFVPRMEHGTINVVHRIDYSAN